MLLYKLFIILHLIIFGLCQQSGNNESYINNKDFIIKNAIYIIRNREGNAYLRIDEYPQMSDFGENLKPNFELIKEDNDNDEEIFYFIKTNKENKIYNKYLSSEGNDLIIISNDDNSINNNKDNENRDKALWKITAKINGNNQLIYYVQNKKEKNFWYYNKENNKFGLIKKSINDTLNENNEFLFIELYQNAKKDNSELLDKEPIDVLIKYIDLSDNTLNRTGVHNILKDYDNEELKYSVRSILQNIPWIRKIFILMPNEKVRFFKPIEEIKDKIVYVKDKTLLGFDSASSCTFQYNLYKMKNFGLSENFILMDDDYFISSPISKNEFFYEENGEIFPALITSDYYEMSKEKLEEKLIIKSNRKNVGNPHSPEGFNFRQLKALLFLYEIFGRDDTRHGKKLIEPAFSHNAIPVKISDIEEIHKYIFDNYEYGKEVLYEKERSSHDLQFQTLYMGYVKNKYGRKVSKISSEFIDISQSQKILRVVKKLFVINTSYRHYNPLIFEREKIALERLFPMKTEYEFDEEEEKRRKKLLNIIDTILSLSINDINEKIEINYEKYNNLLPEDISFEKQKIEKDYDNNYKLVLEEQIKYMKEQCFWQEITNFIFVIFWLLLIIYRFIYIKKYYVKNK